MSSESTWVPLEHKGDIPAPRFGHTLFPISTTKIILFGGATGSSTQFTTTNDAYIFNLFKADWKILNSMLK